MKKLQTLWKDYVANKQVNKARTVKFMFPLVFGVVAVLGAAVITGEDASYVKLVPSETVVKNGETFWIEIYAFASVPVNAIDLEVKFSSNAVEILSVDKAQSVLTIWKDEPVIDKNSIKLSGGTFRRGFMGEHLVATIKAKAKFNGETEFTVNDAVLLAGDGKGTEVAVDKTAYGAKTSFYIYNQNEAPDIIRATFGIKINEDINGDGKVTLADISAFLSAWHSKNTIYDFNNDKKMNFIDFSIILAKSFF